MQLMSYTYIRCLSNAHSSIVNQAYTFLSMPSSCSRQKRMLDRLQWLQMMHQQQLAMHRHLKQQVKVVMNPQQ